MTPKQQYESSIKTMLGPEIPRMNKVCVEGRCIPGLYARDRNDIIEFCFSHNFCKFYEVPREAAIIFAAGIADALAIGAGYSFAGALTKDRPFAPGIIELSPNETTSITE